MAITVSEADRNSTETGAEKVGGVIRGWNINPEFQTRSATSIINPLDLPRFENYLLPTNSQLRTNGIDLRAEFSIDNGGRDFNQHSVPVKGVGASF